MAEETQTAKPVEYTGRSAALRKTIWIAAEDLDDVGEVTKTINRVVRFPSVCWPGGRQSENVPALEFEGKDGEMRYFHLNAESRKVLEGHSRKAADWKGLKVTLYVKTGIRGGNGTGRGVRIRLAQ